MNEEFELKNAIISSAQIELLHLDYGGSGQSYGGFALHLPPSFKHHKKSIWTGHFLSRVMEIAGVQKWSELPGKTIRVNASWSKVKSIGHIIKDDWFDFSADVELHEQINAIKQGAEDCHDQ